MKSCKVNAVTAESTDQVNYKNTSNVEGRERVHIGIENAMHIGWYKA